MPQSASSKLSQTRIRILRRLAGRDIERDGAETAAEIADGIGVPHVGWQRAFIILRCLADSGLVSRLDLTPDDTRPWTITEAGRAALAKASA